MSDFQVNFISKFISYYSTLQQILLVGSDDVVRASIVWEETGENHTRDWTLVALVRGYPTTHIHCYTWHWQIMVVT